MAKILENMEIGHNVMHGQCDWMNDPEIHSATWEWDNVCPADQWKHSHNYLHHTYTNVIGKDKDVGYEILRVRSDQPWHPYYLTQPVVNTLLMLAFEYGVSLHDLDIEGLRKMDLEDPKEFQRKLAAASRSKQARQIGKDYVLFPAAGRPDFVSTATANFTANIIRNIWSYAIIFCGHFPDGAEVFTEEELENETQGEWYLRQLLGSANFTGNRLMHVMSGSLGYQIEHHLFPDLPCNRYPEIAGARPRAVREVRPALHHRVVPAAVLAGHAVDLAALAAGEEDARGLAASSGPRPAAQRGCGQGHGLGQPGHAADPAGPGEHPGPPGAEPGLSHEPSARTLQTSPRGPVLVRPRWERMRSARYSASRPTPENRPEPQVHCHGRPRK